MFKKWVFLFALLLIPSALSFAQQTPQAVKDALDDLNTRLKLSLTLNDLNWRWSEEVWNDSSYGCPLPGQTYQPGNYRGYDVQLDYKGVTWDYRVSSDRLTLILCSPLTTPTPTPRIVLPPTATPTATLTPTPTATPASCPNSPTPRLVIGQTARVLPGDPNIVREQPGRGSQYVGEMPAGESFIVVDGPRCVSDVAWWAINYTSSDGAVHFVGWTPEGQDTAYWLEPLGVVAVIPTESNVTPSGTQTPTIVRPTPTLNPGCSLSLPQRLAIGVQGQVTPGLPNNVRDAPGESSRYLGEIPPGGMFTVVDGPRCASGMTWWQVNYNGLVGWTPEGQNKEYWLEPVRG
jgi:hypothetical protein